ncbi:hypothetical protein MRB53_022361 [Persea americana]|uniref:Uncharacterized protein n=1 Tax=Persea americana TaxID=3435 RepID=A0ACC2L7L1_PERAE|nr:hypothetical protein MRB53_022361 [Persea americana]
MQEYLHQIKVIADQLATCGAPVSEDDLVLCTLSGLPLVYRPFQIAICTRSRHDPVSLEELHTFLVCEELSPADDITIEASTAFTASKSTPTSQGRSPASSSSYQHRTPNLATRSYRNSNNCQSCSSDTSVPERRWRTYVPLSLVLAKQTPVTGAGVSSFGSICNSNQKTISDSDLLPLFASPSPTTGAGVSSFRSIYNNNQRTRNYSGLLPLFASPSPTTVAGVFSSGFLSRRRCISSHSKRNANQSQDGTIVPFPFWAASKLNEGELFSILDSSLEGNADIDELDRACRVACWCIQEHEASRPSMGQVVQILEGVLQIDIPPLPCHLHRLVGGLINDNLLLSRQ